MSAAYQLRKKGHQVVVFEAYNKLGGMLTFGLPAYRTPRDVVDAEVKRIIDMGGIEVRCNTRVGKDITMDELRAEFDAVFIGIGAQAGNKLDIPGADAPNVTDGITFLRDYNEGRIDCAGKHIVVIGGGDTAMDVAAVARRLGAECDASMSPQNQTKVTVAAREGQTAGKLMHVMRQSSEVVIAYRRHVQEMPCTKHEIDAVIEEGVEIAALRRPGFRGQGRRGPGHRLARHQGRLGQQEDGAAGRLRIRHPGRPDRLRRRPVDRLERHGRLQERRRTSPTSTRTCRPSASRACSSAATPLRR